MFLDNNPEISKKVEKAIRNDAQLEGIDVVGGEKEEQKTAEKEDSPSSEILIEEKK